MKEEDAAIKEEVKEDDDWEDIDAEDGQAEVSQSDFTLISDQKQTQNPAAPESSSEFTLISQQKGQKSHNLSEFDQEKLHALEEISSHLNEKEAQEFMEKNSKAMHSDVYNFKENQKKVQILDSRELLLPNGKVLGHRDYRHIYKQHIVI